MSIEPLPRPEQPLRTDAELAAATSSGCAEAYAELHRRYYLRLVRLCQRRTGDHVLAEDIAQETMIRLRRYLPGFDTRRELWPWIRGIALRQCATWTQLRARELLCADSEAFEGELTDPADDVVEQAAVRAALGRVPDRQRLALTLVYLNDLDHDDAAQVIGVKRNAFDQLVARGRVSLNVHYAAETAVRLLGLLPLGALIVRRFVRRVADAAGSAGVAAPLLGATLAAAAGMSGLFVLDPGRQGPSTTQAATKAAPFQVGWHDPARHALRTLAPSARHLPRGSAPAPSAGRLSAQVSAYVSPTPLKSGTVAQSRITIPTPVGTVTVGSTTVASGDSAACSLPIVRCT